MPFKFWKREKPEKEKGKAEEKKKAEPAVKAKAPEVKKGEGMETKAKTEGVVPAPKEEAGKGEEKPKAAPAPPPAEVEAAVAEVHGSLVELGLTIPGTKGVFTKRVADFPGGVGAFVSAYKDKPYRAVTRVLGDWLGLHAPADFDPAKLLGDVNLRLSSFKLSLQMSEMTWLDQELGLRKARMRLADQEKVVRFKDARDFVKGVNELLVTRKLAFLELETWSNEYAFILVREPKWDKLAATSLVVVKAPQTAVGGECGECGAPVGSNWHDCLSCGAVFGTD